MASPHKPESQLRSALLGLAVGDALGTVYQRFPIKDVDVPDAATLEAVLGSITDTVSSGRKAAVHCWSGVGRTGTVIGCYLVRYQRLDGAQALAKITKEWQGVEKRTRKPHSPETAEQCQLVEVFK